MRSVRRAAPVLRVKALTRADAPGTFEAVISLYGNRDAHGDVVALGAFAESLGQGLPPVVWSHDWLTPPIGVPIEMVELDRDELEGLYPDLALDETVTGGLYAKGRLLVDVEAGEDVPLARHVYAAFRATGGDGRPALREFSWGGKVLEERAVRDDEGQIAQWVIEKARMDEWGPCLRGANPLTELLAAKAAGSFAGVDLLLADVERGALTVAEARKRLAAEMGHAQPSAPTDPGAPAMPEASKADDQSAAEPSPGAAADERSSWTAADVTERAAWADVLLS